MKGDKAILKMVLKGASLILPVVLTFINHLQMEDAIEEAVNEALASKEAEES